MNFRIELLFHELAHQKIYVQDDTAFNEAFAMFVAQEGVRRIPITVRPGSHTRYPCNAGRP